MLYFGFPANSNDNIESNYKWFADNFDLELTFLSNNISEKINKNDEILKKISQISGNSFENFSEEIYEKTKNNIINTAINSINKAKQDIKIDISNIVFFVTMFSADDRALIEKKSSLILNNNKILNDFHKTLL